MYSIYVCSIRGGACVLNLYVCSIRAMSGLGVLHVCVLNLYLHLYLYEWTIRRGNLANTNPTLVRWGERKKPREGEGGAGGSTPGHP